MDANQSGSSTSGFVTILLVLVSLVALYYFYTFLYSGSVGTNTTTLVSGKMTAGTPPEKLPTIPSIYEGGEYSVNTWVYVTSYHKNQNSRKHIFELRGSNFSTLIIGLGAFKNTLMVRVHTADPTTSVQGFQNPAGGAGAAAPPATGAGTPNTTGSTTSLSRTDRTAMFRPMSMNDSLMTAQPMCDLPEIDLQRWVMLTVILSGRTVDVYLDGKLARSCVLPSFYKVDPTGVTPVLTDGGGFDGFVGTTTVANYAMNPGEIYNTYMAGPGGASNDILKWIASFFTGGK